MNVLATHHVAIFTRNMEAMENFYTQTLGFPVTKRWDDKGIIFINVGSTEIELISRPDNQGEPAALGQGVGINHLALHVASTDDAWEELTRLGVAVLREPSNFQDVRIAFFSDPDGNALELVQEL